MRPLLLTCIAGIARDGRVYMGADSAASTEYSWFNIANAKLFVLNEQFLIGCAGSFRMIDLMRYSLSVPEHAAKLSADAYMRTKFINAVRKCCAGGGFALGNPDDPVQVLIGYRGALYELQSDSSIISVPAWGHAVGSGEGPARGSLWTSRTEWDSLKRIQVALEAAEATVPSVRAPFITAML